MKMKLPILYHKSKSGDLRQWTVWSDGDTILTEYGQVGGKLQTSAKKAVPKNVGRSNATTAEEQAKAEAQSLWNFKIARKYSLTPEKASEELMLPMLAHKYEDKKKHVTFDAYVQPKLDGVRCLAQWDGKSVALLSRSGKPYTMPHIQSELEKWMPKDVVLDGELYCHGMSCQMVTSFVKKWKDGSEKIIFNIYDAPVVYGDDSLPFEDRFQYLKEINESVPNYVDVLDTFKVISHEEVMQYHGKFLENGYEGAILRLPYGLYLWGYRSAELLKVKEFQDNEFLVVGAKEGKGKMANCVIWTCQNDMNELQFDVSMKATMDERRLMYTDKQKYIGNALTIRYFDRTDDQLPRFPVGIVFRDVCDLS